MKRCLVVKAWKRCGDLAVQTCVAQLRWRDRPLQVEYGAAARILGSSNVAAAIRCPTRIHRHLAPGDREISGKGGRLTRATGSSCQCHIQGTRQQWWSGSSVTGLKAIAVTDGRQDGGSTRSVLLSWPRVHAIHCPVLFLCHVPR